MVLRLPLLLCCALGLWGTPAARAGDLPETLTATLARAEAAELPAALLEAKAREGLAKGVPAERIVQVVDELLADWQHADALLDERARREDRTGIVPAAAAALRQHAAPDVVIELAELGPEALWALADVIFAGVPAEQGARLVRTAAARTDARIALLELPQAARLLVARNGAEFAVREIDAAMGAGRTPLAAPGAHGAPPAHANAGGNPNNNGNAWGAGGKPK